MRNESDERRIEQCGSYACSPETPAPWYPVPPDGKQFRSWTAVAKNGELVALFEGRRDCEFACQAVNMLAEWHRNNEAKNKEMKDD